jgi:hypothetical protein
MLKNKYNIPIYDNNKTTIISVSNSISIINFVYIKYKRRMINGNLYGFRLIKINNGATKSV